MSIARRVKITTVPFGDIDSTPLELLAKAGVEVVTNSIGRRLRPAEVKDEIGGFPVIIAGTETINAETIAACHDLKAICRVGIGLDSVDLIAARRHNVAVSYTPDAPSPAVAELTMGLIFDLLRGTIIADRDMRRGKWTRIAGRRVAASTIGVIGVGRIGLRLIRHLQGGFPGVRVLANDLTPKSGLNNVEWVDKETLFRESDVVSVHVPLRPDTFNLISKRELALMKPTSALVNTARGGIVDEDALAQALSSGVIRAAALDVFSEEPYAGKLNELPNLIMTCHMGSMTADCRAGMEIEATREAIRFLSGESLQSAVPEGEYQNAEQLSRH